MSRFLSMAAGVTWLAVAGCQDRNVGNARTGIDGLNNGDENGLACDVVCEAHDIDCVIDNCGVSVDECTACMAKTATLCSDVTDAAQQKVCEDSIAMCVQGPCRASGPDAGPAGPEGDYCVQCHKDGVPNGPPTHARL